MACTYEYTDTKGKRQTVDEATLKARYARGELNHLMPKGWNPPKNLDVTDTDTLNKLGIGESRVVAKRYQAASTAPGRVKAFEVSADYARGKFTNVMDYARKFGYRILGMYGVADMVKDVMTNRGINMARTIVDLVSKKDAEIKTGLSKFNKELSKFDTPSAALNKVMLDATTANYDPKTAPKNDDQRAIQKAYMELNSNDKKTFDFLQKSLEDLYNKQVKTIKDVGREYGVNLEQFIPQKLDMYFSLGREGKYVVTAYQNVDGNRQVVGMVRNDDRQTIDGLREEMIKEFPDAEVTTVMEWQTFDRPVLNASQEDVVAKLRRKMSDRGIDDADVEVTEKVLREIFASFLTKKTDNLFRRKNIYGADKDMYRMQLKAVVNSTGRVAALKWNPRIDKAIADARTFVNEQSLDPNYDAVRAQEGLNAIAEGARFQGGNSFLDGAANNINMFGYITTLFSNISSAMINVTSVASLSLPDMIARHGTKGAAALTKASVESSAAGLKKLDQMSGDMKIVAEILEKNNRIHFSDSKELLDLSKDMNPLLDKVVKYGGMPMSIAEQITNIAIGLAEYRLQKEKGLSGDALEQAIITALNNGNPNNASATKGVYTKVPLGRVAFMLKSYGINVVGMMLRDLNYIRSQNISPEEKAIAAKRILGVVSSHAALSGLAGMPFIVWYPIAVALQAIDADDEEKELSPENFLKKRIYDTVGAENADAFFYGMLGAGLAPRVSLNDILVRTGIQQGNETWFDSLVQQLTGPGIANISRSIQQVDKLNNDLKTMPPEEALAKFTKSLPIPAVMNIFKGKEMYETGKAYASDGTLLAEGLSEKDAILQAIGFRPSKVAEAAIERSAIKEEISKVDKQRNNLLATRRYLYQAVENGLADPEVLDYLQNAIDDFNQKYPGKDISAQVLERTDKRVDEKRESLKVQYKNDEERELAELLVNWAVDEEE